MHHPSFENWSQVLKSDPTKDSPSHSLAGRLFLLYPQSSDDKEGEMRYKADESAQIRPACSSPHQIVFGFASDSDSCKV